MEAVGDLARLRRTPSRPFGIETLAIPVDDLDTLPAHPFTTSRQGADSLARRGK